MHGSVVFDGKMWVIGGGVYDSSRPDNTIVDYSDVWWTTDGKEWIPATREAEWTARRFHGCAVYDDKIWVVAGYHHGNRNDVWSSDDGRTWVDATSPATFPVRHEAAVLVFEEKLWVIGGYGANIYNDVWSSSDVTVGK